jgi:threonyl-tRNA synthetase
MLLRITLPDGSVKEYSAPVTPLKVAFDISPRLADATIGAEVNGKLVDIEKEITTDSSLVLHTFTSDTGKDIYWHSTSHLMAQAVKLLYPNVKVTIGPSIEQGFYYDFDRDEPFTEDDLLKIEAKMKEITAQNLPYERKELTKQEAIDIFTKQNETYKLELIEAIPDGDIISVYTQGDFIDLCRGPHVSHTGKIKAFKLLKTSGAYWRGDEKNKMLKRIYGISFPSNKELTAYLDMLEEAKKRDHRKLGKDLDLFSMDDEVGPGLVLWHPNGAMMRHLIEAYWKEAHLRNGYKLVYSPHIGRSNLWQTSGHLGFYNENMYAPMEIDEQEYYLKPMNCPFHIAIYKSALRSYRELPMRLAELGTVYRYERSGVLHGLMRVRGFTQDDAHIICTAEQLTEEVENILTFSMDMLKHFGFENFQIYLSTMPDHPVGDPKDWEVATETLRKSLIKLGIDYAVDEGGGAFYGPKIDIKIKDALNRSWQCTTIQFDFNLPTRFNMEYIGADNQAHRPYMVHRAVLGSMERFFGTLLEYHAGNMPLWLCPIQVMVLPITDAQIDYAKELTAKLLAQGIRAENDLRSEKIGYKIREAELKKIPFMLIIGKNEVENGQVTLRRHTVGDLGSMALTDAIQKIQDEH